MVKIRRFRTEKGMSKYRLCKEAGLAYNTLNAIEQGGDLKVSTLLKIAKVLGVTANDLVESEYEKGE